LLFAKVVKAESKTKGFILFFAEAHPSFFIRKVGKGTANRAESKAKKRFFAFYPEVQRTFSIS